MTPPWLTNLLANKWFEALLAAAAIYGLFVLWLAEPWRNLARAGLIFALVLAILYLVGSNIWWQRLLAGTLLVVTCVVSTGWFTGWGRPSDATTANTDGVTINPVGTEVPCRGLILSGIAPLREDDDEVWVALRNSSDLGSNWYFKRAARGNAGNLEEWRVERSGGNVEDRGDTFHFYAFTLNRSDSAFLTSVRLQAEDAGLGDRFLSSSPPLGLDDAAPQLSAKRKDQGPEDCP